MYVSPALVLVLSGILGGVNSDSAGQTFESYTKAYHTAADVKRPLPEFAAIEENETLAESLGLVVWKYRTVGFVVAAGLAGLAGFALVNMLMTAHPSSFSSFSGVNYIAYAIVGGRGSLLGPVLGTGLLVWTSNLFSSQGQYSAGLFGLLIIGVVTVAPGGLIGTFTRVWNGLRGRAASPGVAPADAQAGQVAGTTPAKQG